MAARAVRGPAAAEELTKERRPLFGTVHMRLLVNINTDLKKKTLTSTQRAVNLSPLSGTSC